MAHSTQYIGLLLHEQHQLLTLLQRADTRPHREGVQDQMIVRRQLRSLGKSWLSWQCPMNQKETSTWLLELMKGLMMLDQGSCSPRASTTSLICWAKYQWSLPWIRKCLTLYPSGSTPMETSSPTSLWMKKTLTARVDHSWASAPCIIVLKEMSAPSFRSPNISSKIGGNSSPMWKVFGRLSFHSLIDWCDSSDCRYSQEYRNCDLPKLSIWWNQQLE